MQDNAVWAKDVRYLHPKLTWIITGVAGATPHGMHVFGYCTAFAMHSAA
jgi:hypothetical protein